MSAHPLPSWCFSLVVVKLGRRFLLVHERKHGQGWFLPAGRLEPGETFADAALRETLEEAGIHVELEGVLRVEQTAGAEQRMRVVFLARPRDDAPPKSVADEHSLQARWVTVEELAALPLRGDEVTYWLHGLLEHRIPVAPLSILEQRHV
jgi:phosphatase NudJ